MTLLSRIRRAATNVAVPYQEWPSIVRRRRLMVCVVLVAGAVLLGFSLRIRPGDDAFYFLTVALAATWTAGAFLSGPLHLGGISWRGRNQRPVITGTTVGLVLGVAFLAGTFVFTDSLQRTFDDLLLCARDLDGHDPVEVLVFDGHARF